MTNEEMDLRAVVIIRIVYSSLTTCVRSWHYIRKKTRLRNYGRRKKGKDLLPCSTVLTLSCRFFVFPGKVGPPLSLPPPPSATYFLRTRTLRLEGKRASKKFRANNNAKDSGWLRRMLSKRRAAAKIPVYPHCHPTVELLYYTPHVRDSSHRNGKTSERLAKLPLIIIRYIRSLQISKAGRERNNKIGARDISAIDGVGTRPVYEHNANLSSSRCRFVISTLFKRQEQKRLSGHWA